ncbi:MAG: hypothetical protein KAI17_13600, partial [Thiotrichaceae bacterium]|nr:hypothetical protein [Thiotrichaceae bacterium]
MIKHHSLKPQSIPIVCSDINLGVYPGLGLASILEKVQIKYKSGRHSIYIESLDDIAKINPDITKRFPFPVALKLIKSQELSPDKTPYYTSHKLAPASTWFSMVAVGSMLEQAVVSNLLNEKGVAPRVYDIIRLEARDGSWRFAYVVQPIKGKVVTGKKGEKFITRFKVVLEQYGMETISIKEHCDLSPPDFRNNIRSDSTGTYYVDIQNFVQLSSSFGKQLLVNIGRYRNKNTSFHTQKSEEISTLNSFLTSGGLDLSTSTCMDICMPNESLMIEVMAEGCGWYYCVRSSEDVLLVRKYLYYHSFCRFDVLRLDSLLSNDFEIPVSDNKTVAIVTVNNWEKYQTILGKMRIQFLLIVGDSD